jgi:D-alanyl-D-alanine carboxypeptidase
MPHSNGDRAKQTPIYQNQPGERLRPASVSNIAMTGRALKVRVPYPAMKARFASDRSCGNGTGQ